MSKELHKVSIDFLLRDQNCYYNIYLLIRDKFIKIRTSEFNNYEELIQLKAKGSDFVYLDQESFVKYIGERENEILTLEDKDVSEKIRILEELTKDENNLILLLNEVGVDEEKIKAIGSLKQKSIEFLEGNNDLNSLVSMIKEIKPTPMLKKNLEIFIGTSILRLTENYKNKDVIDSYIYAILMFDLLLTEEEFWASFKKNPNDPKILRHSVDVLDKIPLKHFPSYIIPLIKCHHEKPDGSGYPNRITCNEMNFITMVYIVVEEYVQELIKRGMRSNEISSILDHVENVFHPYLATDFNKVVKLLKQVVRSDCV